MQTLEEDARRLLDNAIKVNIRASLEENGSFKTSLLFLIALFHINLTSYKRQTCLHTYKMKTR